MTENMDVQRWLFKMDSEHGGRGTAYCDICHLSCYNWALQEYHRYGRELWNTKWIQVKILLKGVRHSLFDIKYWTKPLKFLDFYFYTVFY